MTSELHQIQRPFLEYETTGNDAAREEINRLEGPALSLETDHADRVAHRHQDAARGPIQLSFAEDSVLAARL